MPMTINGSSGLVFPDGSTQPVYFATGTALLFQQTAAPTGWTKITTNNNAALRIVSGTASTGGTVDFTVAFAASLSSGATTLSVSQMPSHQHAVNGFATAGASGVAVGVTSGSIDSGATGGGGSHTHTLPSFAVKYVDVISATKN
jgi:hypothetical protein